MSSVTFFATPQPCSTPLTKESSYSSSSNNSSVHSNEWETTIRKNCLKTSVMEPCVTKAAAHLEELKGLVKLRQQSTSQLKKSTRTPSPDKKLVRLRSGEFGMIMESPPVLKVEGVSTGATRTETPPLALDEKSTVHGLNSLIAELMGLVAKLESDRQQTLLALTNEIEKARQLKEVLDKEKENRLQLLPELVQAEHEQCLHDLRQLKWHATVEWKKLKRHQENEQLVEKLNTELKNEVKQYSESGPQIILKLKDEDINIKALALLKEETSNRLQSSKKIFEEIDAKLNNLKIMVQAEYKEMEEVKKCSTQKLGSEMEELRLTEEELEAITQSLLEENGRIDTMQKKIRDLDMQNDSRTLQCSKIMAHVDKLNKECCEMEEVRRELRETTQGLADDMGAKKEFLEEQFLSQLSDHKQADRKLRQTRRDIEEIEQDIDTIRETIAEMHKKTVNDERNVERAQDELATSQVEVSVAEFAKVKAQHETVVEKIAHEKRAHAEEESFLTGRINFLEREIRDEMDIKVIYERKIAAHRGEILKKKLELGKAFSDAQTSMEISEEQTHGQGKKVNKIQDSCGIIAKEVESLECELAAVSEETRTVDRELEGKKATLSSQGRQLRVEVQEIVNRIELVTELIKPLESKVEDVSTSANMTVKLEGKTNSIIDQLGSELSDIEEKLTKELQKEKNSSNEFKEISDFSADAVARHCQYLKDRKVDLKQSKCDLHDSLNKNSELSANYIKLQQDFLETKARVLVVVERKLELENNLRDYKKLLELMSQIIPALKEYYHSRGMNSHWKLCHFGNHYNQNAKALQMLKEQFQTITSLMHTVLDMITKQYKQSN